MSEGRRGVRQNTDAPWDRFDPKKYFQKNYASLRSDDAEILRLTATHFARALSVEGAHRRRAIDVGAGVNLYPSMAMLPFCGHITLYEYAPPNLLWLKSELSSGWATSWKACADAFWDVLAGLPHGELADPLDLLAEPRLEVRAGSVYELDEISSSERWDLGTMFFVAESITEDPTQFRLGIDRFLGALEPEAPFVIAFMEHRTQGYHVGPESFPSTDVDESDIKKYLNVVACDVTVTHIGLVDHEPLDDPYCGMVVACGTTKSSTETSPSAVTDPAHL